MLFLTYFNEVSNPAVTWSVLVVQTSNWSHFERHGLFYMHEHQKVAYDTVKGHKNAKVCEIWSKSGQKWPDFGNFKRP